MSQISIEFRNINVGGGVNFGPERQTHSVQQKAGSESLVQYQSDLSQSERSVQIQASLIRKDSNAIQQSNQSRDVDKKTSRFQQFRKRMSVNKVQDDSMEVLKQMLRKQMIGRFIDNLLTRGYILTESLYQKRKHILDNFFGFEKRNRDQYNNDSQEKESILNYLRVFHPQDNFTKYWDLGGIAITLFMLWLGPFINSFQLTTDREVKIAEIFLMIYIILDGLITCNKAIIFQGELITLRSKIVERYIYNQFSGDLINLLIWSLYYFEIQEYGVLVAISFIHLIFLIFSVYTKIQQYVDCLYLGGNLSELLDLALLILVIFFFAHIISCIFHFVGIASENLDSNWLINYGIADQGVLIRYNYSLYWATMTMTTVGYGDITAQNYVEIITSNIIMFCSSVIFAYSMNSIGIIVKSLYETRMKYKRQLILINSYLKNNMVENGIQIRVRNYLKYYVEQESSENVTDVNNILNSLPLGLKTEVTQSIKLRLMHKMKIIVNNFSKATLSLIAENLQIQSYIPQDLIYKPTPNQDQQLYFILKGSVFIREPRTRKLIQRLEKGNAFGEISFFTGFNSNCIIESETFTELYTISREKFIQIIQYSQKDFQLFHHIKDSIIFRQDYGIIEKACNICNKYNHVHLQCPFVTYIPDLERMVKAENFITQVRDTKYIRKECSKIKSVIVQNRVQSTIFQYQKFDGLQSEQEQEQEFIESNTLPQSSKNNINEQSFVILQQEKKPAQSAVFHEKSLMRLNTKPNTTEFRRQSIQKGFQKQVIDQQNEEILIQLQQKEKEKEKEKEDTHQHQSKNYIRQMTIDIKVQQQQFHNCNIERGRMYINYQPNNNLDEVLKKVNKFKSRRQEQHYNGPYTFQNIVAIKCRKIKQILNPDQNKKSVEKSQTIKRRK